MAFVGVSKERYVGKFSHIRRVEFEVSSFCNRHCEWCPNSKFDRSNNNEFLSEETYLRVLNELNDEGFGCIEIFDSRPLSEGKEIMLSRPIISFNGYSEPLANAELLKKRIIQAKSIISKNVHYTVNTNGDYLSIDTLKNLKLNKLSIMDYDNKGEDYWRQKFIDLKIMFHSKKKNILIGTNRYIGMVICALNWKEHSHIEDRGGFLSADSGADIRKREVPCIEPSYFITISHNGDVVPCCHIRQDNPNHKQYILGNVNDNSLVEILYSEKAIDFQNRLYNLTDIPDICKHCTKYRKYIHTGYKDLDYNPKNYIDIIRNNYTDFDE